MRFNGASCFLFASVASVAPSRRVSASLPGTLPFVTVSQNDVLHCSGTIFGNSLTAKHPDILVHRERHHTTTLKGHDPKRRGTRGKICSAQELHPLTVRSALTLSFTWLLSSSGLIVGHGTAPENRPWEDSLTVLGAWNGRIVSLPFEARKVFSMCSPCSLHL